VSSTSRAGLPVVRPDASLSEQYEAVRSGAAVHVLERDFVSVTGAEAEAYLQGQCSQDVTGLSLGTGVEALLLNPQGKIEAVIRVTRTGGDTFVIDTDPGSGPDVVTRLERFRLRTKVDIVPLEGWIGVAVRGPRARTAIVGSPSLVLEVDWPGLGGLDLLGPSPTELSDWVDVGRAVPCGSDAWEAARIEAGIPVVGRDEVGGAIPAETGLVDRTVSFTKGCYTGQELVARLDARGSKVARRLCGVVIAPAPGAGAGGGPSNPNPNPIPNPNPEARLPVGAVVLTADGEHEVGRLTSVAWSPGMGAAVALAMVHRRVEVPGPVLLRPDGTSGPDERPAEARPLPLRT
jgi:tRNA-modifying protein YgfZ